VAKLNTDDEAAAALGVCPRVPLLAAGAAPDKRAADEELGSSVLSAAERTAVGTATARITRKWPCSTAKTPCARSPWRK